MLPPVGEALSSSDPPATQGQGATFVATADGVIVDVLVTRDGRRVTGLLADDFEVRDDGVPQAIQLLETSALAINAVLVLDVSASTAGQRLEDLKDATRAFIENLGPSDRAAVTTFNHAVVPGRLDMPDAARLTRALESVNSSGGTAVFDAVYSALLTTLSEPGRSIVLVCTDGRDTASWLERDEVLDAARRTNATVYAVATGDAKGWPDLGAMTEITGGMAFDVDSSPDLRPQFAAIVEQFRQHYVITFTPANVKPGGFHNLDVRVQREGVKVRARSGYFGRSRRQ